ncbi:hypothetical protein HNR65_003093 [Desulfosalsimonas propionicica]|uniref:Uncharacterized protein n=1 Tax=Desulfosalsimonas propionicica TaxID=332175 RepID=A0A7W0HLX1_9BACT|nr:hypothetical protein [Desulfosalsimonas propionicica]MBA2882738.1 hypothetical protein [Desulfosalsimonas propionicica]
MKKEDKHAPFIKATKPEKKAGANVRKFCVPWIAIVGYKYVNTRHKTVPFLFPVLDTLTIAFESGKLGSTE